MNERGYTLGIMDLFTVLFVGLKLTHVINWDWVWVLTPLWLPILIAAIISVIFD